MYDAMSSVPCLEGICTVLALEPVYAFVATRYLGGTSFEF